MINGDDFLTVETSEGLEVVHLVCREIWKVTITPQQSIEGYEWVKHHVARRCTPYVSDFKGYQAHWDVVRDGGIEAVLGPYSMRVEILDGYKSMDGEDVYFWIVWDKNDKAVDDQAGTQPSLRAAKLEAEAAASKEILKALEINLQ